MNIRQDFAKAGYPLDRFRDSEIEKAIRHWNDDMAAVTLNAKLIYRIINRLRHAQPKSEHRWGSLEAQLLTQGDVVFGPSTR